MEPKIKKTPLLAFTGLLLLAYIVVVSWGILIWNKTDWAGIVVEDEVFSSWTGKVVKDKVVSSIVAGGPADMAGIQVGDSVLAIRDVFVGDTKRLVELASNLDVGDTLTYQVKRGDRKLSFSLRLERPLKAKQKIIKIITAIFYGLIFLIIGLFVYWKKPRDHRAIVFCLMSTIAAVYLSLEPAATRDLADAVGLTHFALFKLSAEYVVIRYFLFLLLELLTLHLALIFPKIRHNTHVFVWVYGLPLLLAIMLMISRLSDIEGWFIEGLLIQVVLYLLLPVFICITLFKSLRESNIEERKQVRWPLWGTLLAVAGPIVIPSLIETLKSWFGYSNVIALIMFSPDHRLIKYFYLLIPLSFAFAILKYRLMDIDLIIKKTTIYTIITGIIVALYLSLVSGLGVLLVKFIGIKSELVKTFSTLAIAAVFVPVRNRVQNVVERRFFRKKYDYPTALKNLTRALSQVVELQALLKLIAEHLQPALQNRSVVIFSRGTYDRAYVATAKIGMPDEIIGQLKFEVDSRLLTMMDSPFEVRAQDLPEAEKLTLRKAGSAFIVPVKLKNELVGFISLGTKLSDADYDAEDKDFLTSVAEQMAVGVDRIRLREQERDFEKAREIQQGLLPKQIPQIPGYEISGIWQPARAVAGDYYDVIKLSENTLGICIADVVGKGMPAALLMSNLQAIVRAMASEDMPPKQLCEKVNRVISSNMTPDKFITFFYCLLNAKNKKLVYTNAGHNRPILFHQDGSWIELKDGGQALGMSRERNYKQGEAELKSGDRLLLFTDGVTEVMNAEREEFGEERLIELLGNNLQLRADELQKKVLEAVTEFSRGDFQDDVTLITISVE